MCLTTSWWPGSTWRTQSSVSKKRAKCISQLGSHQRYTDVRYLIDDQIFTHLVITESSPKYWFHPPAVKLEILFQALKKSPADINTRAADMWSYAILLWELSTREIPFSDLTPMETGMRIATEGMRLDISPGISPHMAKLIRICMNEDPGKRPTFDQIIPILEKMRK